MPKTVQVAFWAWKRRPSSSSQGAATKLEAKLAVEDLYRNHVVGEVDVDEVEESSPGNLTLKMRLSFVLKRTGGIDRFSRIPFL